MMQSAATRWYNRFALGLGAILFGYLFFDRAFAWLHIPGLPIFAGEGVLVLGALALAHLPAGSIRPVVRRPPIQVLSFFVIVGFVRLLWDFPTYGIVAVRDAAIWYYALLATVLLALARWDPAIMTGLIRWYRRVIPWFIAWGPIAILLSRTFGGSVPRVPDSETSILSFKPGNYAVNTAAALAFLWLVDKPTNRSQRRSRLILTALGMLGILVFGTQNRGGLVAAFAVGGVALLLERRRRGELLLAAGGIALAGFVILLLINPRIPIQSGREVSVQQLLVNAQSVVDRSDNQSGLSGTVEWRLGYWQLVAEDVLFGERPFFGFGFGSNLADRFGFQTGFRDTTQPLRNAHNSHVTILARMGAVGFGIWVLLWLVWFGFAWRQARAGSRRATWSLAAVTGILVNAIFDPTLEGPQVALWLWTLVAVGVTSNDEIALMNQQTPQQRSSSPDG